MVGSCCTSNPNPSKIQAPCNVPTLATQPNPTDDEGDDDGDGDDGYGNVVMWMMVMINCALRDDQTVYWVSKGHYEAVAVGN